MPKLIRFTILLGVISLLTACSREPNQEELQTLYSAKIQSTNALAEKVTQQKGTIMSVKSFEKIDCAKVTDSKDYLCRIKATVNLPFLGDQTHTSELRVTKGENGWVSLD